MNSEVAKKAAMKPSPAKIGSIGPEISVEHYLLILLHRKWLVLILFMLVSTGTAIVARLLPDIYMSETLILVDPQQVPKEYVVPTITDDLRNRLGTLAQQILSSTRLQKIIDTFNLYPEERKKLAREDVITMMRQDITVKMANDFGARQDFQAFRISYSGKEPRIVAQVTNELASLFIEENLKAREQVVAGTADFLENQLEESRKRLVELEDKIRDFKLKHLGEMPEQQQSNIQILGQLQARLQLVADALNRAEQQRSYLQTLASAQPIFSSPGKESRNDTQAQLATASMPGRSLAKSPNELNLAALLTRYGENHPDVRLLKQVVEQERSQRQEAETRAETEKQNQPASAEPTTAPIGPSPAVQAQLVSVETEIAKNKEEQQKLIKVIASYQEKLEAVPVREQEIADLVRDYGISKEHYSQLLEKKLAAQMATQLEMRQKAERFTILDPAQPAQKPSKPNRKAIYAAGAVGGLGLGVAAAISTELLGGTITSAAQVSESVGLTVLGVIPMISTPYDRKRRKRWMLAGAGSGLAMMLAVCAFLLYRYRDQLF